MKTHRKQMSDRMLWLSLLVAMSLCASLASSADAHTASQRPPASSTVHEAIAVGPLASWWQETTASVWSGLASRRAMMRFGAIIFVVALAAIWWRKT